MLPLPSALIGRGSQAVAASGARIAPDQAGGDRVSMASTGMLRMRGGGPSAVARGSSQWDLWSSGASHGSAVYGVVSFIQAYHLTDDGRRVRCAHECSDD